MSSKTPHAFVTLQRLAEDPFSLLCSQHSTYSLPAAPHQTINRSVARQEGVEEVLLYAILMPVFLGIKGPSVGVPGALIADPIGILGLMLKVFQVSLDENSDQCHVT